MTVQPNQQEPHWSTTRKDFLGDTLQLRVKEVTVATFSGKEIKRTSWLALSERLGLTSRVTIQTDKGEKTFRVWNVSFGAKQSDKSRIEFLKSLAKYTPSQEEFNSLLEQADALTPETSFPYELPKFCDNSSPANSCDTASIHKTLKGCLSISLMQKVSYRLTIEELNQILTDSTTLENGATKGNLSKNKYGTFRLSTKGDRNTPNAIQMTKKELNELIAKALTMLPGFQNITLKTGSMLTINKKTDGTITVALK